MRCFLSRLRHRLRVLFNERHEQELREELEFHVEQLAAQHRSAGLGHDEALAASRRQFGNLTRIQEQSHDIFAFRHLEDLIKDLRYGTRLLAKHPVFSLIATLSIGIGVGVNAAMFSFADGMVLRPLRVPHPGEVVAISAVGEGLRSNRLSYPDYRDARDRTGSFAGLAAYRVLVTSFAHRRDEPAQTKLGLAVSGNFFDVLELRPALGRFFLPEEDRVPGRDPVIVLAHDTWIDQFGGDPAVVGRSVRLAGLDLAVLGVAPAEFDGMHLVLPPTFYVPLAMGPAISGRAPDVLEQRDFRNLEVRGRLKPGVSFEQARQEVALLATSLEQAYPATNRGYGMLLKTQFDARLEERGPSAPSAFLLMALAAVVLLVACANVSGLLLSRAPERTREIALRLAIGGGRFRVTRQLIAEAALLAAGGGALGLALAYAAVAVFQQMPLVSDIGVRLTFELDRRAIAVGLALAAASTLLSGLLPAWRATRVPDLAGTLRSAATGGKRTPTRLWGGSGLVVVQVALSLTMTTFAVSVSRAFEAELRRPGFRTTGLLLSKFEPGFARYDEARTERFYELLKERARALAGVTSVGMTSVMPLNQDNRERLTVVPEGYELPEGVEHINVFSARIDEGYLDTMSIPIVSGRGIRSTDTHESPRVALVNQALAARYWPGQDPVGRRMQIVGRETESWAEVVGVTADSRYNSIGEAPTSFIYVSQMQDQGRRSTLIMATDAAPAALAPPLREAVHELDASMPISGMRTIEEFYHGNAVGMVRGLVGTIGGMGALGVALAMVGLHGLVAYAVARRRREIGIRMAVGARRILILGMVLRQGMIPVAWGAAFGVAGSLATEGLMVSVFPQQVGGFDPVAYLFTVPGLVILALLSAYIPAHDATRIDPLVALRHQ